MAKRKRPDEVKTDPTGRSRTKRTGEKDTTLAERRFNPFLGSTRKPTKAKALLAEILTTDVSAEGQDETSIVEEAARTLLEAITDRDEHGNVTPVALQASKDVMDRAFGLPKRSVEVRTTGRTVIELLETNQAKMLGARTVVNEAEHENGQVGNKKPSNGRKNGRATHNGQA